MLIMRAGCFQSQGHSVYAVGSVTVNLSMALKPMMHAAQVVRNCTKTFWVGISWLLMVRKTEGRCTLKQI